MPERSNVLQLSYHIPFYHALAHDSRTKGVPFLWLGVLEGSSASRLSGQDTEERHCGDCF